MLNRLLVAPLPVLSAGVLVFAQDVATTVDDGPYVFWEPDGRARVVAVCDGEKVERVVPAENGFRLSVPCIGLQPVAVSTDPPSPPPAVYTGVSRILAVGDVHGEHEAAVALLKACGVIDEELSWSFADGHVVFDGDVFDRGEQVTETLWLIYRLEQEAQAAGGRVHLVLGNHEVMVLRGDLRYVHAKYLEGAAPALGLTYDEIFGPTSELGRWLRTRNTIVKINGLVFVHAGISPDVAGLDMSIEQLNESIRRNIDAEKDRIAADPTVELLFRSRGPLWYRGYFTALSGYEQATPEDIKLVLERLDARRVVVAHTHVEQVESRYGGLVIGIDVPMTEGDAEAMLWENGEYVRITSAGDRTRIDLD